MGEIIFKWERSSSNGRDHLQIYHAINQIQMGEIIFKFGERDHLRIHKRDHLRIQVAGGRHNKPSHSTDWGIVRDTKVVAARPPPVFLFCPDYSPTVEVLVCRLGAGSTVNIVDRQLYCWPSTLLLTVRPSTQPMSNHGLFLATILTYPPTTIPMAEILKKCGCYQIMAKIPQKL